MYASTTEQRREVQVQALAEELYRERYQYLLRIARRNVDAAADADDAVNDAFAAFIDKFDPASGSPPLGWLTLTLQRRCWALYRLRHLDRSVGQEAEPGEEGPGAVIDALPSRASGPEQLVEQVEEARAKLAALKPQELRALSLLAAGHSYQEIAELNQWTYTKVNRCLTEGRAALRKAPTR